MKQTKHKVQDVFLATVQKSAVQHKGCSVRPSVGNSNKTKQNKQKYWNKRKKSTDQLNGYFVSLLLLSFIYFLKLIFPQSAQKIIF